VPDVVDETLLNVSVPPVVALEEAPMSPTTVIEELTTRVAAPPAITLSVEAALYVVNVGVEASVPSVSLRTREPWAAKVDVYLIIVSYVIISDYTYYGFHASESENEKRNEWTYDVVSCPSDSPVQRLVAVADVKPTSASEKVTLDDTSCQLMMTV
jgi:hypothetical protein